LNIQQTAINEGLRSPLGLCGSPDSTVRRMTEDMTEQVLAFLAHRPLHTFALAGFILSNGIHSPYNRGTFYVCLNAEGLIEGVALIGHATMFEARSAAAIEAFASLARQHETTYLILGEEDSVEHFWNIYRDGKEIDHAQNTELLLERRWPVKAHAPVDGLRRAGLSDLDLVVAYHARLVLEERGVNPLENDSSAFRARCAHRIEQGHTWIWVKDGKLIFKAEIVADTPYAVYLESVTVDPSERRKGYGVRCISQLARSLPDQTRSICLLVASDNCGALAFYKSAGFRLHSQYSAIFL
jgi:predicted GNAT family acetyltransferase